MADDASLPGLLNIPSLGGANYNRGPMQGPVQGFVFHHTGGRGTPSGVVDTLNQRGLGVQYVMDRDGSIYQTLPSGAKGAHILPSKGFGLDNSNTAGMEVIAKDNSDVTPAQVASGQRFAAQFAAANPGVQFFGHGEVNPGHKEADEGMAIVNPVRNGVAPPLPQAQLVASAPGGAAPPSTDPASNAAPAGGLTQPMPQNNTGQGNVNTASDNSMSKGLEGLAKQLLTAAGQKTAAPSFQLAQANTGPVRPLPLNLPKFGQSPTGT